MPAKPSDSSLRARSSVACRRPATATRLTAGFVVMRGSLYAPMRMGLWCLAAVLVAGCARGDAVRLPSTPQSAIDMRVVRPDGAGPFPAVVWLHSCAGLVRGARHAEDWTPRLRGMGYVVAIPDSFSARGFPNGVCGYGTRVPPQTRADDAHAALRHPEERSHVMGDPFAAAIAFYPECAAGAWVRGYRAIAPLLILAGELDDWTPAAPCQRLAAHASAEGQPVSIVVYPRAYHSFDSYAPVMRVPEALQGRGATIGGDNAAREDSITRVEAFLARY